MFQKMRAVTGLVVLALFPLIFSACSTASQGTPSGFLNDYSSMTQGSYFMQESSSEGLSFSGYKAVKVAPVNLTYLERQTACDTEELENLAGEFRADIEAQLQKQGIPTTSAPGEGVLILSVALTNIEPPDAIANAGLTAVSIATPIPASIFDKDGKTSFEGKLTDGLTGRQLMTFAEERSGAGGKMNLKTLTVGKYKKFINTEAVFSVWADKMAKMIRGKMPASGQS